MNVAGPKVPATKPINKMSEKHFITIVSGLPRSGTSLMMQMLAAGGLPPLTDTLRAADASNPRGYLELEAVKKLKTDRSWLPEARGKAVKVIHLLLPELATPDLAGEQFRVIVMRRPIEEVLASQRAMLARQGKVGASLSDAQLGKMFLDQLERAGRTLAGRTNFEVCTVQYPALVADPAREVARVNTFLGGGLGGTAMAQAVDPSLHREKTPVSD